MESLKNKFRLNKNEEGEVLEKTIKFDYQSLIGSFKNLVVFVISILLSSMKLVSGAAPFAVAIFGAINSLRNAINYSMDIDYYNYCNCIWKCLCY